MPIDDLLQAGSRLLTELPLLRSLLYAVALLSFTFAVVFCFELRAGADASRYRRREFLTDLLYALVYQGGIYHTLLLAPVLGVVAYLIPTSWRLELLSGLPPLAGFVVFWILSDAIGYWIHRAQHAWPVLWRFHSVHHAQTSLTFVTSYRNHLFEQLYVNVLMYVPLMLLGMPTWYWLPAMLLQNLFEAFQHSDLRWRYGALYPFVVSPVFHAIHHSPERARHDSNYGKVLSVWDRVFGTISSGERPRRYGVEGLEMPATFWGSLVAPFRPTGVREPRVPVGEAAAQR
jgi:sterol desaturase/sphingolipid hydroxylase (fatty acid hydroxylase superfamily)